MLYFLMILLKVKFMYLKMNDKQDFYNDMLKLCFENGKLLNLVKKDLEKEVFRCKIFVKEICFLYCYLI